MTSIEEKMERHLEGFQARENSLNDFKKSITSDISDLKVIIEKGLRHPMPSATTVTMIKDVKEDMETVKELNSRWTAENTRRMERIERVIFGDPLDDKDLGINQMVKNLHTEFIQKKGIVSFFKLFILGGTATGILYTLFKKFP